MMLHSLGEWSSYQCLHSLVLSFYPWLLRGQFRIKILAHPMKVQLCASRPVTVKTVSRGIGEIEILCSPEEARSSVAAGLLGRLAVASARPVRFWSAVGEFVLTANQQELEESRKRDGANREKGDEHSLTIRGFYKTSPDPLNRTVFMGEQTYPSTTLLPVQVPLLRLSKAFRSTASSRSVSITAAFMSSETDRSLWPT